MESLDSLPSEIRRRCLRSLYSTCGNEALLPKSLLIPLCYNPSEIPEIPGAFSDVWKSEHNGQEVAAKALRVYKVDDLEWIRKVGGTRLVVFPNELTVSHTAVLRRGHYMEDTSSPERATTVRRDDDRESISLRDGIGVDGEWEHQRVSAARGCGSVEAWMCFAVSSPSLNIDYTIAVAWRCH